MGGGWSRTQRVHHVGDARLLPRSAAHMRRHFAMQTSTYETRQTRFTAVFSNVASAFKTRQSRSSRRSHLGNIRLYTRPKSPLASPASAHRNRITSTRQPRPIGLTRRRSRLFFLQRDSIKPSAADKNPDNRRSIDSPTQVVYQLHCSTFCGIGRPLSAYRILGK